MSALRAIAVESIEKAPIRCLHFVTGAHEGYVCQSKYLTKENRQLYGFIVCYDQRTVSLTYGEHNSQEMNAQIEKAFSHIGVDQAFTSCATAAKHQELEATEIELFRRAQLAAIELVDGSTQDEASITMWSRALCTAALLSVALRSR